MSGPVNTVMYICVYKNNKFLSLLYN